MEWTLEDLELWRANAEAMVAVMVDHLDSRARWGEFLRLSQDGANRARAYEQAQEELGLPEAMELAWSLIQNEPEMSDAVRLSMSRRVLAKLYLHVRTMDRLRNALGNWGEWRRGQCDYPDGINPEEQALLEIMESKD